MNVLIYPIQMVFFPILFFFNYSTEYFILESIPYLVGLLHEAINTSDRRSNGLEARELCKGLSKLSVANDNKSKVR
jgi:hypothetical protein